MKISLSPLGVWLKWIKNLACAVAVAGAAGAGAVIAASESLQPMPGNAIVVLCGAVGRCRGAVNPATPIAEGAVVQSLAHPAP
ncbi:hypothetical protein FB547_12118 [Variovorax beijingensis]|uniref:Uncharacterized protein n=1 Tax=Variovorax beijingensis TaxID=2496117 RepID=A0A561B3Z7_9BURK|nr:hypothetical protein [Variovorax beijingensis]TWD73595.1 hypothetical protein FB547_12118 [Variovorax beijingensis]